MNFETDIKREGNKVTLTETCSRGGTIVWQFDYKDRILTPEIIQRMLLEGIAQIFHSMIGTASYLTGEWISRYCDIIHMPEDDNSVDMTGIALEYGSGGHTLGLSIHTEQYGVLTWTGLPANFDSLPQADLKGCLEVVGLRFRNIMEAGIKGTSCCPECALTLADLSNGAIYDMFSLREEICGNSQPAREQKPGLSYFIVRL